MICQSNRRIKLLLEWKNEGLWKIDVFVLSCVRARNDFTVQMFLYQGHGIFACPVQSEGMKEHFVQHLLLTISNFGCWIVGRGALTSKDQVAYDWIFSPNSRALLPTFVQIAQIGLILPRWCLILPSMPFPTSVLYSAVTRPFLGCTYTKKTQPHPNTLLSLAWTGKWVKWTTIWANWDPNWAICLKSGKKKSRSCKKKNIWLWKEEV